MSFNLLASIKNLPSELILYILLRSIVIAISCADGSDVIIHKRTEEELKLSLVLTRIRSLRCDRETK